MATECERTERVWRIRSISILDHACTKNFTIQIATGGANWNIIIYQQELNKKTPAEHPDKPNIEEALKNISSIATNANEKLREEDNYNMLVKIQRNFVGHVKVII